MIGKCAVLVLLLLGLVACSTTASQQAPMPDLGKKIDNPEKARVYIFRADIIFASSDSLLVDIAERRVATLARATYLVVEMDPGDYGVKMMLERSMAPSLQGIDMLELKRNNVYYYEVQFPLEGDRRPVLAELTRDVAQLRLKSMKPAGSN